jgi:uroporphyrinogen decarboxylase
MSYKCGPFISPAMFREFMAPYYRQLTGYLMAHGIRVITVDTDGDCRLIMPELLAVGVTGMYPFEVNAGMNVAEVRKAFPRMQISGGIDKTKLALGRAAIDAEVDAKVPFMLGQGGYVPFIDHLVPPDIPWENFCYYRQRVRQHIERDQARHKRR